MAAKVHETIAIFDKSGKAISTGKTLMGLFKEAKDAYKERKAEVNMRRATRLALEDLHISETRSMGSRRSTSRRHQSSARHTSDPRRGVSRRHTTRDPGDDSHQQLEQRHRPHRSMSMPSPDPAVDLDLAYGEVPPPLPVARSGSARDDEKLNTLVGRFNSLMDEAHCVQHSATAVISTLQRNPDAMAAVAVTLAEISNIVAKVGPPVLASLKTSAPAVVALLASPQFLIAAGVGVGVTVIAFGGYKIVKRLQEKSEGSVDERDMEELREIEQQMSRIDNWRRGIEEVREESEGVSVEGEFITQRAAELRKVGSVVTRSNETGHGVPRARSERSERTERTGRRREKKEKSKEKSRKEKKRGTFGVLFNTGNKGHRQPRVVEI